MTTPEPPSEQADEQPFDPYRFGRPDHPVPPEFAPPGYRPDAAAAPTAPAGYPPGGYQAGGHQSGGQYQPGEYQPGAPYQPGGYQPGPNAHGPYPPSGYPQYRSDAPPPGPDGYPRPSTGRATVALVLGILSIAMFWLVFLDALLIVPALIFGFLAIADARRSGTRRGVAVAGVVCALVGALLAGILTVVLFRAASQCGGFDGQDQTVLRTCIVDRLSH